MFAKLFQLFLLTDVIFYIPLAKYLVFELDALAAVVERVKSEVLFIFSLIIGL